MKKAVKFLLGFLSGVIIFIIMLPLVVSLLLQVGFVQQWAVDFTTKKLSEISKSKISISKIELGLFKKAYFEDVYAEDNRGDTMIYVKKLNVSISSINFITGKIALNTVTVDGGKIFLYKDSMGVVNIKRLFDSFKPDIPPHDPPNFRMSAMQVNLLNTHFKLNDYTCEKQENGVNFKDLDIRKINFQAQDVNILNYDIKLAVNFLKFAEKSGFILDHLSSPACGVNETGLRFSELKMETKHSQLVSDYVNFLYNSWWAYTDFVNMVTLDVKLRPSKLNFKTISYFIKEKVPISDLPFEFEGSVVGSVPRLVGKITNLGLEGTNLNGNFVVTGLPNIPATTFEFELSELQTSRKAVDDLVLLLGGKSLPIEVDKILDKSGEIGVVGRFDGLLTNFNANCVVTTDLGKLNAGLRLRTNSEIGVNFFGNVATQDFRLGQMLNAKKVGGLTLYAQVNGVARSNEIRFNANANIEKVHWNDYDYFGIDLQGEFNNRIFNGRLVSQKDSNLLFTTEGIFDFSNRDMPKYNFDMQLQAADLFALNLNKRDSVSILRADFKAVMEGTNIDNVNGNLNIDSIYYINQRDTVHTAAIDFYSVNSPTSKELRMSSHFADLTLKGKNSYSNIFGYFSQMASTYIPAFGDATEIVTGKKAAEVSVAEKTYDDGYYTLDVNVKKANNVASIFVPGLEIAEGTTLNFFFNPAKHRFSFSLNSDYIANSEGGSGFLVEKLMVDSRNVADSLSVYMTAQDVIINNFSMPMFSVIGGIRNNAVSLATRFSDVENGNAAIINTTTKVYRNAEGVPQIAISLHPSNVRLNNASWLMNNCNVVIDTTGFDIDRFELKNSPQLLAISGKVGRSENDSLNVVINKFNVEPLSFLLEDLGYDIKGVANGNVVGVSLLKNTQFYAKLDFEDILFGGYKLPNSRLRSTLDRDNKKILISLATEKETPVNGFFDLAKKNFKVNLNFPNFDLVLLQPLLKDILVNTSGEADAKLVLSGTGLTPTLNGVIKVKQYNATVEFTKVAYKLAGDVIVKNNRFELPPSPIYDAEGHSGEISAFFDSHYFKNLTFGVNARFTDLLALNTTVKDNSIFYGKAYGTGVFDIKGNERQTLMSVTAQTALNSSIVMPFSNVSTIEQANFITFVDPKKPAVSQIETIKKGLFSKKLKGKITNELDIHLDLQVLPNTTALVQYSNSIMSNIIKGQGRGRLRMRINPSQEIFTLDGPMEIEKGSYRLILEIADKTFSLQPGGKLNFTGDPANPTVDFTGIYKVRTSLEPLTGTIGGGASSANVNCGITLNGSLWNPNISFSITAPSATPETQNLLRNSLNTEEAMSMQFLSLFISNTFMPDMGNSSIGTMGGSFVATTGFEFIFSQLGSLFSTKNFNFRPTYRPRSESASEEFGFKASLNLVQDKVLIEAEGNYATSTTTNRQSSPFTGGGNVTWLLNKSGTLSLKGFTRVIDRFDETQGLQESGLGVYFRQDFQNWDDLRKRYQQYLQRVKENNEKRKALRESKRKSSETDVK